MSRAPGWYLDPEGDAAMRYWDGADWTDRSRPISTEDLPPLDFLDAGPAPAGDADALPVPVSPAPAIATLTPPPPPEVPEPERKAAPEPEQEAAGRSPVLPLIGAFVVLLPVAFVCLLPLVWVVWRFTTWPGFTVWAGWALTAVILAIPAARRALAKAAPSKATPADEAPVAEPAGPLAVLTWLSAPLLIAHAVLSGLTGGADRLWSFVQHMASTGKNRRTTESTVSMVIGLVRATIFWVVWAAVALVRALLHALRSCTGALRWVAAVLGDRMRPARTDQPRTGEKP
ncbi:DUF2510 domain-containing protein [Longispora albida]|uniref:DUF2510 domain-containing protein n=1 Tax=Longispora albida TaxID=203523 RepID=UPI00036AA1A1|nr:DUF2510 domain-containing protein [Longispora albida]